MIHLIDAAAGRMLAMSPPRARFFSRGWGNPSRLEASRMQDLVRHLIKVRWLTSTEHTSGATLDHGAFLNTTSGLPPRSEMGSLISVTPAEPTQRVVVLMAAWNEHNPKARLGMADLLAQKGIRSIVLEHPYYGTRRPSPDRSQPIRTVADFMTMGQAAVSEACGILLSLQADGWSIGVAGYSMGGNTAALVSALLTVPVATAPLCASHSPGPVFLDGVLHEGIAWDALGGRSQEERLRSTFDAISVLAIDPAPHSKHAVIVRASHDGYIPSEAVAALADHWPGSVLREVNAGHATAMWYHKDELTNAIVESFDRLDAVVPD